MAAGWDKNNQNLPSSGRTGYNVKPLNDEVIVRWTEFNNSVGKTKDMFEKHFPNCLFVRITAVGPDVLDSNIKVGNIAIVLEGVGLKLTSLSSLEFVDYFIIYETDILFQKDVN